MRTRRAASTCGRGPRRADPSLGLRCPGARSARTALDDDDGDDDDDDDDERYGAARSASYEHSIGPKLLSVRLTTTTTDD